MRQKARTFRIAWKNTAKSDATAKSDSTAAHSYVLIDGKGQAGPFRQRERCLHVGSSLCPDQIAKLEQPANVQVDSGRDLLAVSEQDVAPQMWAGCREARQIVSAGRGIGGGRPRHDAQNRSQLSAARI